MFIITFIPLAIIIVCTFCIIKSLSLKKAIAIWLLGIALFLVAGFTGFLLGDVNRMYIMKGKTYKLINNTSISLNNGDCEGTAVLYKDAVEQMNTGASLDEAMNYISNNVRN